MLRRVPKLPSRAQFLARALSVRAHELSRPLDIGFGTFSAVRVSRLPLVLRPRTFLKRSKRAVDHIAESSHARALENLLSPPGAVAEKCRRRSEAREAVGHACQDQGKDFIQD